MFPGSTGNVSRGAALSRCAAIVVAFATTASVLAACGSAATAKASAATPEPVACVRDARGALTPVGGALTTPHAYRCVLATPSAKPSVKPAKKRSARPKLASVPTQHLAAAPASPPVRVKPAAPVVKKSTGPCVSAQPPAPTTGIYPSRSQQVIVMQHQSGTFGTFARYQWVASACAWENYGTATGVFGQNGVVPAAQRVQGSNQTPAGTFPLIQAFGVRNPGTRMPYTTLTSKDWWDERPSSKTYNELLTNGPDGCNLNDCEQLIRDTDAYGSQMYDQAVFVGFNLPGPNQKRSGGGSGAGIFLHFAHEYTGGCVAINDLTELTDTVAWLNPIENPLIVIRA